MGLTFLNEKLYLLLLLLLLQYFPETLVQAEKRY